MLHGQPPDDTEEDISEEVKLAEGEKKLSENILVILDHFKQPDPVGVPGADIPDPFAVPDIKKTLSLGTLVMTKTVVYGMSKLRIQHIDAEVGAMQVLFSLSTVIEILNICLFP